MCPTPKSLKTDKQTFKKMASAVTGYHRIQQLNQFFPENDVQKALKTKIGKNVMVVVSDFLLGNDYTRVESPYLPTGLLEEIRSKKNIYEDIGGWTSTVKSKLLKNKEAVGDEIFESTTDVLRFVSIYSLTNKQSFVETVLKKCAEFYHTVLGQNKAYSLSETSTRNGAKKTTEYYNKMTRNRKLFYAISETIIVYLGMLEDGDLKKKYTKELLCMYLKVN